MVASCKGYLWWWILAKRVRLKLTLFLLPPLVFIIARWRFKQPTCQWVGLWYWIVSADLVQESSALWLTQACLNDLQLMKGMPSWKSWRVEAPSRSEVQTQLHN
jgi:hypothetical protein